ncbi:MAG: NUDIX hydrolase [Flavisolibacter sp.]
MFNLRVYGILINDKKELLVSDELIRGKHYTKFPGGGLEFGEGPRDCLKREFLEEMNLNVEVLDHIYTTDYFQESAFHSGHQIISIYYYVNALESISCRICEKPFDFDAGQMETYEKVNEIEAFRFIPWEKISPDEVTLPIDKIVVNIVKQASDRINEVINR